jgi:glycosyltransferase involved in cell wall biosynthesis
MEAAGSSSTPPPVTVVVLVWNEAPNLPRTLRSLAWAPRVLVVDSGSTDGTTEIARGFENVRVVANPFRSHGRQWEFGVRHPEVETPWVLALDADMSVDGRFVSELEDRFLVGDYAGGTVPFAYAVDGRRLLGSFYPRQLRLFRRDRVRVADRGHTQEFSVDGPVYRFRARVTNDDRKSVERHLASQVDYSRRECDRIARGEGLRFRDRLRRAGWMAPAMFVLSWVRAGGPFRGRAALRYAHERAMYEAMLTLRLLRADPPDAEARRDR